jgi:hypothetical protein
MREEMRAAKETRDVGTAAAILDDLLRDNASYGQAQGFTIMDNGHGPQ